MLTPHPLPNWIEICLRWHQATVSNNIMCWRAVVHWFAAEALILDVDGHAEAAESMRVLSDLAQQIYLDLLPHSELEAA